MRLLFITQKIHKDDDDLAFTILWVQEFIRQGVDVQVICLEKGVFDDSFPVHSLYKERGAGLFTRIMRFFKLIFSLEYDAVFVHMNMEYVTLGGWWWLTKKPLYIWYTHYTMHIHLWLAGIFARKMFAATSQSMPQYDGNPKKVVTGHGIDTQYWLSEVDTHPVTKSVHEIISVHRLSRSKRLDIAIHAIALLPSQYSLTVYGRPVDQEYYKELLALVKKENLESRVHFMGPVPMGDLKYVYPKYSIMINMASETIDKTMLEGMLFGVFPITTKGNAQAIGIDVYPEKDTPESVAQLILSQKINTYKNNDLRAIVESRHGLRALITRLNEYIVHGK
ncbi:glycosyltransferase family 4 protein [Candidatus Kaiserbacteria bacterium]|nr:glycosyltransferase family 4 protein [Candidatus Kaiserbacteria bacterium]